jgi:signal transduction histidine kinase
MAMPISRKSDDLLQRGGLLVWGMVGASAFLGQLEQPRRLSVWILVWLAFGLIHVSLRDLFPRAKTGWRYLLLGAETACVLAMVHVRCDGFEGALLVLVAMQLGPRVPLRTGLIWILVQSLLFAAAIAQHWSLSPALMLTPPYIGFQVLAFLAFRLLEQEARAQAALQAAQEQLVQRNRMAERVRIAGELHDVLGHRLTALNLNLEIAAHAGAEPRTLALHTAAAIGRSLMEDLRRTVDTLHPPPGADLAQELRNLVVDIPNPRIHLELPGPLTMDPARSGLLLRCAQELTTNAIRHASAERIWIRVSVAQETLELTVRDDGAGASGLKEGRGLRSMRERVEAAGGSLELITEPGTGLTARILLPLPAVPA